MKKPTGWKGESRRHSLARKGIKTVIDDKHRLAVNNYVARGEYDVAKMINSAEYHILEDKNLKESMRLLKISAEDMEMLIIQRLHDSTGVSVETITEEWQIDEFVRRIVWDKVNDEMSAGYGMVGSETPTLFEYLTDEVGIPEDELINPTKMMASGGYEWMASVPDSVMYVNPNTKKTEWARQDEPIYNGVSINDAIMWLENDKEFHDNTTKEQMKKSLRKLLKLNQDVFEQDFEFYVDHVMPQFLKTEFMLHGKYKKGMIGSGVNRMSIADARRINKEKDHHFFDRDTMKFFNGRIHTKGDLIKGKYFIDSTQYDDSDGNPTPRRYHIREFNPKTGSVLTVKMNFPSLASARNHVRDLE